MKISIETHDYNSKDNSIQKHTYKACLHGAKNNYK